jgi:hypothetical protein
MSTSRTILAAVAAAGIFALIAACGRSGDASDKEVITFEPTQEATEEPTAPDTEIRSQGYNAEVVIEPSSDNVISGIVTIRVTKAPAETEMAFFAIVGNGSESIETTGPNLGIDSDVSDGWSRLLDTTEYEDGLYEVAGLAMSSANDDPIGMASAQVMIQN